jgi:hypothetical protein
MDTESKNMGFTVVDVPEYQTRSQSGGGEIKRG